MLKEILQKAKERKEFKKELYRSAKLQDEISTILEERKKSANQRELERYIKEQQEEQIKKQLEVMRKIRDNDIRFNHNPLDVKNITKDAEWKILKEKNLFGNNSNIFANQRFIHKSNKRLLKSGNIMHGKNLLKIKGGKKW